MDNQKISLAVLAAVIWSSSVAYCEPSAESGNLSCIEDRESLLSLDQDAFDQDLDGGWRAISHKEGCEIEAADLIRDYRAENLGASMEILYWHEGQVRAGVGQYDEAIELFLLSKTTDQPDWNFYVDGTIAFLRNDREALDAAVAGLKLVPKPDGWDEFMATRVAQGQSFINWPMNLGVLEGFQNCFGQSYNEAYGRDCRP